MLFRSDTFEFAGDTTNTYTGVTLVGEGAFIVNGALPNSPVTVRGGVWLDGRLGGTGVVGRHVVDVARERGHDVVVLARAEGVDLTTGAGLAEKLAGADAVVAAQWDVDDEATAVLMTDLYARLAQGRALPDALAATADDLAAAAASVVALRAVTTELRVLGTYARDEGRG